MRTVQEEVMQSSCIAFNLLSLRTLSHIEVRTNTTILLAQNYVQVWYFTKMSDKFFKERCRYDTFALRYFRSKRITELKTVDNSTEKKNYISMQFYYLSYSKAKA